jgi:hypothetical protein
MHFVEKLLYSDNIIRILFMFWPSRLENIDEVLRYARLSGYLYIRSVRNLSFLLFLLHSCQILQD